MPAKRTYCLNTLTDYQIGIFREKMTSGGGNAAFSIAVQCEFFWWRVWSISKLGFIRQVSKAVSKAMDLVKMIQFRV